MCICATSWMQSLQRGRENLSHSVLVQIQEADDDALVIAVAFRDHLGQVLHRYTKILQRDRHSDRGEPGPEAVQTLIRDRFRVGWIGRHAKHVDRKPGDPLDMHRLAMVYQVLKPGGHDDRETGAVRCVIGAAQLGLQRMLAALFHAGPADAGQIVVAEGSGQHQLGPCLVIRRIGERDRRIFDDRAQCALGILITQVAGGRHKIAVDGVGEDVSRSGAGLERRHGVSSDS